MDAFRTAFVALAILTAAAVAAQDRSGRADITVSCESRDGRRASCPANLQGYTFKDLDQRSNAPCEAGRNWGYTERGVWVDGGCRAEFAFRYESGALEDRDRSWDSSSSRRVFSDSLSGERVIECESQDGRREECSGDLRGMRFVDVRQRSRTTCEIGRNFGYNDRGMWVEEGCRGEFLFRSDDAGSGPFPVTGSRSDARGRTLICESTNDDYEHCDAPGIVSARVARQISRSECEQGDTWGVDERGVWVDDGCRAEFEVFTRLSDSPTRPTRW